ncbi:GNAT family N-acetyltransferase [Sphingomonas sp. ID1715]|uniref:GNAT family N-acetyltransferase n=1 Tax=Sphingomonas sp. ID1715 TaxID=1656898 RepID=UPI0020C4DFB1|nr:GNAT family N-acetyltransferase [Sphingomonas sp. ID1715]
MWVTGEYFDSMRAVELAARGRLSTAAEPFARLDWFKRVWAHAAPGERPLIARARAGAAEAWLFLARTRPARAVATPGPHFARFAPIFLGEPDEPLQRALIRAAARRLRLFGLSRLSLGPMLPEHAALLASGFRRGGWTVVEHAAATSFTLDVGGRHFEDVWEGCSARLHERVATGARQLHVEIADLVTPRLWEEVELLGGTDAFLRDLGQDATLDRTLRLGIVRVGDAPVAAQLWTVEHGHAFAHWRAEDRAARQLFPADQLTASMLRYAINVDHAQHIDFGQGRAAELGDWAEERRVLRRLELFNPRRPAAWAPALAARATALVRRPQLD